MFIFVTRLKNVKDNLILWKKNNFSNFGDQVVAAKAQLDTTQSNLQLAPLCQASINNERTAIKKLHQESQTRRIDEEATIESPMAGVRGQQHQVFPQLYKGEEV